MIYLLQFQIPSGDIIGWRSPNLKTAGDDQPRVLKELNYTYDISLTYDRDTNYPFPFTLDFGYPYPCKIPPCPSTKHPGFWEVMVHTLTDPNTGGPCAYVDSCRPEGEDAALEYMWSNFLTTYENQRAPFGLNMHAAWYAFPGTLQATRRFIEKLLITPDVYIVNVRQMMEWMRNPVDLSQIKSFRPWGCGQSPPTTTETTSTTAKTEEPTTSEAPTTTTPTTTTTETTIITTTTTAAPYTRRILPFTISGRIKENETPSPLKQIIPMLFGISTTKQPPAPFKYDNNSNTNTMLTNDPSRDYRGIGESQNNNNNNPKTPFTFYSLFQGIKTQTPFIPPQPPKQQPLPNRGETGDKTFYWQTYLESGSSLAQQKVPPVGCKQGINCHLPSCLCKASVPPFGSRIENNIPQIIYLAIDSQIDGHTFSPLMQLFSGALRNPNGCPISGSIFIPTKRNYPPYVEVLKQNGLHIGLRSHYNFDYSMLDLTRLNIDKDIASTKSLLSPSYGWRSLGNLPPSDAIFRTLVEKGVRFDNSIINNSSLSIWPYTLDFGTHNTCSNILAGTDTCKRYPGLWEIPLESLRIPGSSQECLFIETCSTYLYSIEELLEYNFNRHFQNGRAPFGINLNRRWLMSSGNNGLKGVTNFLAKILRSRNVMVISIDKMIGWITSPGHTFPTWPTC